MRTVLAAVLLLCACSGGVFQPRPFTLDAGTAELWVIGDLHYGTPIGNNDLGKTLLRKMVRESNADPNVTGWVVTGDYAWGASAMSAEEADSLTWLLRDSLAVPVYHVVGNWEWAAADTGTGHLYDDFIRSMAPGLFRPYSSPSDRGRRWYGLRVPGSNGPSNVCVFAVNNNRDASSGTQNYYVNNPKDGSGVLPYDFDGISDPTSAQRRDLAKFVSSLLPGDWLVLLQHRSVHPGAVVAIRPAQEDAEDPDSSQVQWLDDNLGSLWVLVEGDQHENKVIGRIGRHVTVSACAYPRDLDAAKAAAWLPRAESFVYADTVYSAHPWSALVDSLGANAGRIAKKDGVWNRWVVYQALRFSGRRLDVLTRLVQTGAATATVDSVSFYH